MAARLDEGLEALHLLWSGERVAFRGKHVVVEDVTFLPTPCSGRACRCGWPARPPMRRAARWDGAAPILPPDDGGRPAQPDAATVREIDAFLRDCRAEAGRDGEPFDLVMSGMSPADPAAAADLVRPLEQAGATWWNECRWDDLESAEAMLRRVDQGPPPAS